MGGAVFAPTALGVLNGCRARPGLDWEPEFFSERQAQLVTALAEIILPADDDSPGAAELGVPAFIEEMIYKVHGEDSREGFLEGLDMFNAQSEDQLGSEFLDLSSEEQLAFAEEQNREMIESDDPEPAEILYFFRTMKELTITGYFTTEVGATEVLRHEAVPGYYEGCIPFEEVGKTWAV